MTSPVGPAWSDGLYLEEALPTSDADARDIGAVKTLPLSGDRALLLWLSRPNSSIPGQGDEWRVRVVKAGDPVTGGPVVSALRALDVQAEFGWTNVNSNYAGQSAGITKLSETRFVVIVQCQARKTNNAFWSSHSTVLLGLTGEDTLTVLDTYTWWQDSGVTGRTFGEWPDVVTIGPTKVAVFVYDQTIAYPRAGTVQYLVYDTAEDQLLYVTYEFQSTPLTSEVGGGVWCNGEVGVLLSVARPGFCPFRVVGDSLIFADPTEPTWTWTLPTYYQMLNEGIVAPGPGPNQFVTSTYDVDPDKGSDYLNSTIFETDGTTVTIVDQSLSYNDNAGYGYPSAWLPNSVTPDGKVLGVYANGGSYEDNSADGKGGHGHQHQGQPVLLIDMMGKATWDQVTESQMPTTGAYSRFPVGPGYWMRVVQATETGAFVVVGSGASVEPYEYPAVVGWVSLVSTPLPLVPALTAGLGVMGQMFDRRA